MFVGGSTVSILFYLYVWHPSCRLGWQFCSMKSTLTVSFLLFSRIVDWTPGSSLPSHLLQVKWTLLSLRSHSSMSVCSSLSEYCWVAPCRWNFIHRYGIPSPCHPCLLRKSMYFPSRPVSRGWDTCNSWAPQLLNQMILELRNWPQGSSAP